MSSIERRAYLRYKIIVPTRLENSEGMAFESNTRDISLGGMQVNCDVNNLRRMLPNGIKTAPSDGVVMQADLSMPNSDESITLEAHVQGVLRMAESTFSIRFSFDELSSTQQDQLQRLLKHN